MRAALWIYPLLFAARLLTGANGAYPVIHPDEVIYRELARYFAGVGPVPDLAGTFAFPVGYPLLVSPLFRLFDTLEALSTALLVFNAAVSAALFFPVRAFLHEVAEIPARASTAGAVAAALYPAYVVSAGIGVTEHAFVTLFALLCWLGWRLFDQPTLPRAAGFGLLAVALYAVHERALLVIGVACAQLVGLALIRRVALRHAATVVLTCAVGLYGVGATAAHVASVVYRGGAVERPLSVVLTKLLRLDGWIDLGLQIAGQTWYLLLGTGGLFALGVGLLLHVLRIRRGDARGQAALLLLASAGAIFGSCAVYFPANPIMPLKAEYMYFGRINEGFLPIFLAAGFAVLTLRRLLAAGALAVALGAVMVAGRGMEALADGPGIWGVFGTWWLVGDETWLLHPVVGTALVCGVAVLLAAVTRCRPTWMAAAVAIPFLWLSVALAPHYYERRLNRQYARTLTPIVLSTGHTAIAVDTSTVRTGRYAELARRISVAHFDSRFEPPPHPLVLSNRRFDAPEARFLAGERDRRYALWTLPGTGLHRPPDPRSLVYGATPVWTVHESGLRDREPWINGEAARVIRRRARVTIPLVGAPPAAVRVEADRPVEVEVDGRSLGKGRVVQGAVSDAVEALEVVVRGGGARLRSIALLDADELATILEAPAMGGDFEIDIEGTGPLTVEVTNTGSTAWVGARLASEGGDYAIPRVVMPGRSLRFGLSPSPGRHCLRVRGAQGEPACVVVRGPPRELVPLRFLSDARPAPAVLTLRPR